MADEPATPPATPPAAPPPAAWHTGVEPDTIGFWQNKGYDLADPKALATELTKQYRAAEKHIGAPPDRLIRLPEKPEDIAGWNGVYERLGVPKEAKDYDLSGIKRANGNDIDPALSDAMRAALHSAHVPKDRAADVLKAVVKTLDDTAAREASVLAAEVDKVKADLKKNWGGNYDYNLLKAMEGARRLGMDKAAVDALESQIGYARVMDALRKIGQGTSEDVFVDGARGPNGQPTTVEGAQARLNERMADPAWGKRLTSGDAETTREFNSLMQQIAGEAA